MLLLRRRFLRVLAAGIAGLSAGGLALDAAVVRRHRVARGETLSSIAARYGVTVAALRETNRIRGDAIQVGQVLVIPAAAPPATTRGAPGLTPAVVAAIARPRVEAGRWRYVVGHHSGIDIGNARIYDNGHRARGMENGLAYHFVIGNGSDSGDGEIEIGHRWTEQIRGGHVRRSDVNDTGIGICVVGNFQHRRPSRRQLESFRALVDHLDRQVLRGSWTFAFHREIDRNHTVCPGRHFPMGDFHERYAARSIRRKT